MQSDRREEDSSHARASRRFLIFAVGLFLLHAFLMLYRFGERPLSPVLGDEVIINDPAIALSRGQGLIAPSFTDSSFGVDKLYSHFPPLFLWLQSLSFRTFGVSVYSLRLLTTLMDLLAAAAFLLLLRFLCLRRAADWGVACVAACLYTVNASLIIMHRIARMESTIECLLLAALFCIFAALYSGSDTGLPAHSDPSAANLVPSHQTPSHPACSHDFPSPSPRARHLALFAAAILCGLALAVHPEALVGVLPIALLILFAFRSQPSLKLLLMAVIAAVPAAIWVIAYRAHSLDAIREMGHILLYNTPPPGLYHFARAFFLKTHRTTNAGMQATLFCLCLLVFELILLRWYRLEKRRRNRLAIPSAHAAHRLFMTRLFAASTVLDLLLLNWLVSASATRYEVLFPVFLVGLVVSFRAARRILPMVTGTFIALGALIIFQCTAIFTSFHRDDPEVKANASHRFDAIVDSIPLDSRVATSPSLWLAFQQKNRPVTMLYSDFDGMATWRRQNPTDPFARFDTIITDTARIDDYSDYAPYAALHRVKQTFKIGHDTVNVYRNPH